MNQRLRIESRDGTANTDEVYLDNEPIGKYLKGIETRMFVKEINKATLYLVMPEIFLDAEFDITKLVEFQGKTYKLVEIDDIYNKRSPMRHEKSSSNTGEIAQQTTAK
jgi:hypothetical protein